MARGKSPIELKLKDNRFRARSIGVFISIALIVLMLLQVSPKLALAFAGLAILSPFAAMIYFFYKLGKDDK